MSTCLCQSNNTKLINKPLLSFSPSGQLWSYYLGVIACLRDHFDLNNVRVGGTSGGAAAASVLFFDLTIIQAFKFGFAFKFESRLLKYLLLPTKLVYQSMLDLFKEFNINDEILNEIYQKKGVDAIYFGVSQFNLKSIKHIIPHSNYLHSFSSLREITYAATCSMRTLPFFRSLGYYKNKWVFDGAFTKWFIIPKDQNVNQIITISPLYESWRFKADIQPKCYERFKFKDWVQGGSLNDTIKKFNLGYENASQKLVILKLIEKGLIWKEKKNDKKNDDNCSFYLKQIETSLWKEHINCRINYWNNLIKHEFDNHGDVQKLQQTSCTRQTFVQ